MRAKDLGHRVANALHRSLFRASGGKGSLVGMPVLELFTTGRKTGKQRSTMLTAPLAEDDRIVVVASFGGDDRHPTWYLNLRSDPRVRMTFRGQTREMLARTASEDERAELWPRVVRAYRGYEVYQHRTERPIPLIILEPEA